MITAQELTELVTMSQNPDCPYCGSNVRLDHVQVGYDEKVKVRCPNCGGQFEYMPGFGSFSLPGEGPRTQRRVTTDGAYPSPQYGSDTPWTTEPSPKQQSGCGTCCWICCCCLLLPTIITVMLLGAFGGFWWLFG
ncbi:MAG: MJ0042-type zinc finger domain-containing protein [Candidatus Thorarchaeota archaeon]